MVNVEWGCCHQHSHVATHPVSVQACQMDARNSLLGWVHHVSEHTSRVGVPKNVYNSRTKHRGIILIAVPSSP